VAHAHNGFLDLWLGLGLLGVILVGAALVIAFQRSLVLLAEGTGVTAFWPSVFLSFLVLYNVTESSLLSSGSLFWILFCVIAMQPAVLAACAPEAIDLRARLSAVRQAAT
jgi:O-antigen ligase